MMKRARVVLIPFRKRHFSTVSAVEVHCNSSVRKGWLHERWHSPPMKYPLFLSPTGNSALSIHIQDAFIFGAIQRRFIQTRYNSNDTSSDKDSTNKSDESCGTVHNQIFSNEKSNPQSNSVSNHDNTSPLSSDSTLQQDSPFITSLSPENRQKLNQSSIDPKTLNQLNLQASLGENGPKVSSLNASTQMSSNAGVYIAKDVEDLFYRFLYRGIRGVLLVIIGFCFLFWVIRRKRRETLRTQYEMKRRQEAQLQNRINSQDVENALLEEMRSVGYDVDEDEE